MATNSIKKYLTMNVVDLSQGLQSIHTVGKPVSADISAAWVQVGVGNIIRVVVSGNTYFAFSDIDAGATAVTAATDPGVMIVTGEHYIIASGEYIRASANPTRVEILNA